METNIFFKPMVSKLLPPTTPTPPPPTTTTTLTVLGPDGFAAGKKKGNGRKLQLEKKRKVHFSVCVFFVSPTLAKLGAFFWCSTRRIQLKENPLLLEELVWEKRS